MASRSTRLGPTPTSSGEPNKIGHYILGKTLGIGSFGKVKRTFCIYFDTTLYIISFVVRI